VKNGAHQIKQGVCRIFISFHTVKKKPGKRASSVKRHLV